MAIAKRAAVPPNQAGAQTQLVFDPDPDVEDAILTTAWPAAVEGAVIMWKYLRDDDPEDHMGEIIEEVSVNFDPNSYLPQNRDKTPKKIVFTDEEAIHE